MNARVCLLSAALALAAAMVLGAFGAHALKAQLAPDLFAVYLTAVQYHFWNALGLLGVALLMLHFSDAALLRWTARLLILGLLLFSGSLYFLVFTGQRWLGAVTPLGGVSLIAAWLMLAWFAIRLDSRNPR